MLAEYLSSDYPIAGFWRRIFAFIVDSVILGSIGWAAGLIFFDAFVQLGPWGRLLGFCVALVYFGVQNSKIAGGQTFGKRLLKIRVVGKNGAPLSVQMAFVRFLPLGAPWFLNNAQFPPSLLFTYWIYPLSVAIFGIGLSIVYLYVFNRKTRQSLHDLLVGSYVVSGESKEPVEAAPLWKLHSAVCVFILAGSCVVPYFTSNLATTETFAPMINVGRAVSAAPWVAHAQVQMHPITHMLRCNIVSD